MWKRISLVLGLGCLFALLAICSGCSDEEAVQNLETVRDLSDGITPYVPADHTYVPVAISVLTTAALSIMRIVKERRIAKRMEKAIKAKGRQIDSIISAPANPDPNKPNPVLTYLRTDKSTANDIKFDALADFDTIRKGGTL